MVEEGPDQAHARGVLHGAVRRAEAQAAAGQAGGQGAGRRALAAFTPAAAFADEAVCVVGLVHRSDRRL